MARIIEYDERDYGGGGGSSVGSAGVLVVVVLVILYLSGYLPWFSSASPAAYNQGYVAPTAPLTPAVGNISYVTAERLNMRESPGNYSMVTYILPRGTKVVLLGNSYREPDGGLWVQVQIDTMEGVQTGWVNRLYIS